MKKRKINRITGRLLSIFMAAVMTAGMVCMPVYAVMDNVPNDVVISEQGDASEEDSSSEDVTEEDASDESNDEIADEMITESETEPGSESEPEPELDTAMETEAETDIDDEDDQSEISSDVIEEEKTKTPGLLGSTVLGYIDDTYDGVNNTEEITDTVSDAAGKWEYDAETATLTLKSGFKGEYIEIIDSNTSILMNGASLVARTGQESVIKCSRNLQVELGGNNEIILAADTEKGINISGRELALSLSNSTSSGKLTVVQENISRGEWTPLIYGRVNLTDVTLDIKASTTLNSCNIEGIYGNTCVEGSGCLDIDIDSGTGKSSGIGGILCFNSSGYVDIHVKSTHKYSNGVSSNIEAQNGTGTIDINCEGCRLTSAFNPRIKNINPEMGTITLQATKIPAIEGLPYNKTISNSEAAAGYMLNYLFYVPGEGNEVLITDSEGIPLTKVVITSGTGDPTPVPIKLMDSPLFDYPEATVGERYPQCIKGSAYYINAVEGGKQDATDRYLFELAEGSSLPAGLTIDKNNGCVEGTPTEEAPAGSFKVVCKAHKILDSSNVRSISDPITINYGEIKPQERHLYLGTDTINMSEDAEGDKYSYDADSSTLVLSSGFTCNKLYSEKPLTIVLNGSTGFTAEAASDYVIKVDGNLNIFLKGESTITLAPDTEKGIDLSGNNMNLFLADGAATGKLSIVQTGITRKEYVPLIYGRAYVTDVTLDIKASTSLNECYIQGISGNTYVEGSGCLDIDMVSGTGRSSGVGGYLRFNSSGHTNIHIKSTHKYSNGVSSDIEAQDGTGTISINCEGCRLTSAYNPRIKNINPEMGTITLQATKIPAIEGLPYNKTISNPEASAGYMLNYLFYVPGEGNEVLVTDSEGTPLTKVVITSGTGNPIPVPIKLMDSTLFDYPEATVGESYPQCIGGLAYYNCAVVGGKQKASDRYRFELTDDSSLPAGLSIDESHGCIEGTPTEEAPAGSFKVVCKVYDGSFGSDVLCISDPITIEYGAIGVKNAVTGVSLDTSDKTLEIGDEFTLTATVSPADASIPDVTWNSGSTAVAKVTEDGTDNHKAVVKATGTGKTNITVTSRQGYKQAICSVTVKEKKPTAVVELIEGKYYLTHLAGGSKYKVGLAGTETEYTADGYARIEIDPAFYGKTINVIKVAADSLYNSQPQAVEVSVILPANIAVSYAGVPLAGGAAAVKQDIALDTGLLTCDSISWNPMPDSEGKFQNGVKYTATIVLHTISGLMFETAPTVSVNGKAATVSLSGDKEIVTAVVEYDTTSSIINVESIAFSADELSASEDAGYVFYTLDFAPASATNKDYTITSNNTDIVYIEGKTTIVPKAVGTATVTAVSADGNKSAAAAVYIRYKKPSDVKQNGISLEGFVPNGDYSITVNSNEPLQIKASATGEVPMQDTWYSSNLSIVRKYAGEPKCDSEPFSFYTEAKPTIPTTGLFAKFKDDIKAFTYTGEKIEPEILVYNNGELLTKGDDYTLKYSNNVNVARNKKGELIEDKAKVTVSGRGNLSGSATLKFTITPKNLGSGTLYAEDVKVGNISVVKNSKATSPVITFKNYKLSSKDYTVRDSSKKHVESGFIDVSGKGNFDGDIKIMVNVAEKKSDIKNIAVTLSGKGIMIFDPAKTDADLKTDISGLIKVYASTDKNKEHELTEGADYFISYPSIIRGVGSKKVIIIGKGDYNGSIAKTITIKPLVVKAANDNGWVENNAVTVSTVERPYVLGGVTVGDVITVKYKSKGGAEYILSEGTDYKVTYSNNKAVSTDAKPAEYTISFIGSYKGTPAIKNTKTTGKVNRFKIVGASLEDPVVPNAPAENVDISFADLMYSGKPGTYKSVPYITLNGVTLASSNYKVTYYTDALRTKAVDKKNPVTIPDGDTEATVYVTILGKGEIGKGNYVGTINTEYKVYRKADDIYDLSKARVTLYDSTYDPAKKSNKKLSSTIYTGKPITVASVGGKVVVDYKVGKNYVLLEEGKDYELEYLNHTSKGTAVIMVKGLGTKNAATGITCQGARKTTFKIVVRNLKTFLKTMI